MEKEEQTPEEVMARLEEQEEEEGMPDRDRVILMKIMILQPTMMMRIQMTTMMMMIALPSWLELCQIRMPDTSQYSESDF